MMKASIFLFLSIASVPCFGSNNEEKTNVATIYIHNQTPHKIMARVEGFGVVRENCKNREYALKTGGVNIQAGSTGTLQRICSTMQFPIKSVLYQLYASALMVRVAGEGYGDINSEAYFADPFDQALRKTFIVTGDQMNDRYQLEIHLSSKTE